MPVINRRKVRMTSSHHSPYTLGDTRATMAGTKGHDPTRVRSNVDPTFYSLVGSRWSGGTTTTPLFSRIHTSLISVWTIISRAQTKNYEITLSFWGDREIIPFEPFFFMLSRRYGESSNQFPNLPFPKGRT
ncbi:hypothetical protein AMTRI_Chr10g227370 [Amborella trichopoda]